MICDLQQCIEVFAEMAKGHGFDTADGARNNCGDVSKAFATLLDANGITVSLGQLIGVPDFVRHTVDPEEIAIGGEACHIVTKVGDRYIDWTRRQYDKDAPFPHVASREELEQEGWEVTDKDAGPYLMKATGPREKREGREGSEG